MSLLTELKSSTQSEHDSIEASLNLMDPEMTLEKYKSMLSRFYGFYAAVEPELEKFASLPLEKRAPVLEKDLGFFNISPSSIEKLPPSSFSLEKMEDALGMLYVLEGSSLGAQVLSRHFEEKLKVQKGKGLDFFFGHGRETMPRWLVFKDKLEALGSELKRDSIIVSAKKTFSLLESWLTSTH